MRTLTYVYRLCVTTLTNPTFSPPPPHLSPHTLYALRPPLSALHRGKFSTAYGTLNDPLRGIIDLDQANKLETCSPLWVTL